MRSAGIGRLPVMATPRGTAAHPGTVAVGDALDRSQPLVRLLQRLQQSRDRHAAVCEHLPDALRDQIRPGPLDDAGWTLLVSHGAAASKLRQLLPTLDAALRAKGWAALPIRIKVQAPN
jgi:hypothetical protein